MGYRIWHSRYQEGFCALGALLHVAKDEEILRGMPRAAGFPADAYYEMRADFPRDIQVPDNVYTMIHQVVSTRLWQVLEPSLGRSRVEALPVKIKNHKGRLAKGEFFVLNPIDVIDCIDLGASGAVFNLLDPTQIMQVDRLVLRPLPNDVALFRPQGWTRLLLIREDLAGKLLAAGLTGLVFLDPSRFEG